MNRLVALALVSLLLAPARAHAQESDTQPTWSLLPHPDDQWWSLSGQVNVIEQAHPSFPSPYAGPNSFRAESEHAVSRVLTIFTGWEAVVDIESAVGSGLSDALGLAGFTDLDVVRNPALGTPYVARAMMRKIVALSPEEVQVAPTPLSLSHSLPARRVAIRAGKLGAT